MDRPVTKIETEVHTSIELEPELINGLRTGNSSSIRSVYKRNLPSIKKMVQQFPAIILEAEDVLQEGLVRTITNIREGKFRGASSVHSYLYAICRNICLKESRKTRKLEAADLLYPVEDSMEEHHFDLLNLIIEKKKDLDPKCIEIIDLRFGLNKENETPTGVSGMISFAEIAEIIGIQADNARQRFSRCLEKLISAVTNTPGLWNITTN